MKAIGPGDRVRCIDDDWVLRASNECQPRRGMILTVREVLPPDFYNRIGYRFVEIRNPPTERYGEPGYNAACFVPIDDDEIEIFRDLPTVPEKEPAL